MERSASPKPSAESILSTEVSLPRDGLDRLLEEQRRLGVKKMSLQQVAHLAGLAPSDLLDGEKVELLHPEFQDRAIQYAKMVQTPTE